MTAPTITRALPSEITIAGTTYSVDFTGSPNMPASITGPRGACWGLFYYPNDRTQMFAMNAKGRTLQVWGRNVHFPAEWFTA